MNKKLRHITKEEFETGDYGECGEIYVEDKMSKARITAFIIVVVAMLGTLYILINLE